MNNLQARSVLVKLLQSTQKDSQVKADSKIFNFQCRTTPNGRIFQKKENTPLGKALYQYSYDNKGHLTEIVRNGKMIERYAYNQKGQRVEDYRAAFGGSRQFIYGHDGALIRVSDAYLDWTPKGQLKAIYSQNQRVEYEYGNDTRLDKVYLPSGSVVQYEYNSSELMPVRVLAGYKPAFEYIWKDSLQLQRCVDIQNEVSYAFSYGKSRTPDSVSIQGKPESIQKLIGQFAPSLNLRIWVDQIGSIRALASAKGTVIKYIEYDAFGNISLDTKAGWNFPLGFAGCLNDIYTGFVRFGFRDYDPQVGRFTAKDPIGYTGGDYDLWDYCVDDPVNKRDIAGLLDWHERFIAKQIGKSLAGKLGGIGWLLFPDSAGCPEVMYHIRQEIMEIENRIEQDKASKDDIKQINKLRKQEDELWMQFGEHHYNQGYEHVFPSKEYIERKKEDAKRRR